MKKNFWALGALALTLSTGFLATNSQAMEDKSKMTPEQADDYQKKIDKKKQKRGPGERQVYGATAPQGTR